MRERATPTSGLGTGFWQRNWSQMCRQYEWQNGGHVPTCALDGLLQYWTWIKMKRKQGPCKQQEDTTSLLEIITILRPGTIMLQSGRVHLLDSFLFPMVRTLESSTCARPLTTSFSTRTWVNRIWLITWSWMRSCYHLFLISLVLDTSNVREWSILSMEACNSMLVSFLQIDYCNAQSSSGRTGAWVLQTILTLKKVQSGGDAHGDSEHIEGIETF